MDAIFLGTTQHVKSLPPLTTTNVTGTSVSLSENIKIRGVVLDSQLSFNSHNYLQPFKVLFLLYWGSSTYSPYSYWRHHQDHRVFIGWLPPQLCQLHAAWYIDKKRWTASSNTKLSGASHYTTMRTNQHHEDVQTYTGFLSSTALTSRWQLRHKRFYSLVNHRNCHR